MMNAVDSNIKDSGSDKRIKKKKENLRIID